MHMQFSTKAPAAALNRVVRGTLQLARGEPRPAVASPTPPQIHKRGDIKRGLQRQ